MKCTRAEKNRMPQEFYSFENDITASINRQEVIEVFAEHMARKKKKKYIKIVNKYIV